MTDSAPQYALDALDKAIQARGVAASGHGRSALGDGPITLPSLSFKFKAPSFLGNRSRWVLFIGMFAIATFALVVAWQMVESTATSDGAEWVGPPIMTVIVAALALAFGFACVMGFGEVELNTSIGTVESTTGDALTVAETVPSDGADGIGVDVEIEATFSEPVDPTKLTDKTFVLRKRGDAAIVPATVTAEDGKKKGRLKPKANLVPGQAYEAEISKDVTTASGTALAATRMWTFTTKA